MSLSIDPVTKVITVPQADLTLVSGTLYRHDTNAFRLELKGWEDSDQGMVMERTHNHNTEVSIAGVTYARLLEIINGYSVEYEDGAYTVLLEGSNNNVWDVGNGILVQNQVQVIPQNSAGLITVTSGSGVTEQDKDDIRDRVWNATESSYQTLGTMGRWLSFLRKMIGNKATVAPDDTTSTIYDDDKVSPYHVFDHSDSRNRDPQ